MPTLPYNFLMNHLAMGKTAVAAGLLVVISGCTTTPELSPAPSANEARGLEEAAVSTVEGVNMVAGADAWPGRPEIREEVTPLRVTIENNSNQPLRIRYSEFALVSSTGKRYAALPPFAIEGDVEEPVVFESDYAVPRPAFSYNRFSVAPFYAGTYPAMQSYPGAFYYDQFYYDRYYTYWREIDLPTEEMLERALPEGVIDPGGQVEGFLYFEKVDVEEPRVRLRADLVNARDGDIFGTITIPFTVQES